MKKIISIMLGMALILSTFVVAFAEDKSDEIHMQNSYKVIDAGTYDLFNNYVDGYGLFIDKGMTVDMNYSSIATVLENENKRIEIYKQSLANTSRLGYINYSNKFLNNTIDHNLSYNGEQNIGGRTVHITAWDRKKLSRVDNDKNYYLSIDIQEGGFVYTIFVKANAPIGNLGGYEYLAQNFSTMLPSKYGHIRQAKVIDIQAKNWNQETIDFYQKYFGEKSELTWGIFSPQTAMFDYNQLGYYENYFNYQFPIILNYSEFENTYKHQNLQQRLESAHKYNKTLELTLQTNWTDTGNMMYQILDGKYDEFLYDYAKVIKDFSHPVLFRPFNEMNGDWCPYSSYHTSKDTMVFKETYRYIHDIFKEVGVNNAIWIWNPNGESFPNFKWNNELMYYPGDEYVDIVGMTAYNTGTYYASTGEKWTSFKELYNTMYGNYCMRFEHPLMITEFSSANMGGDKDQWVIDMFNQIHKYDRIKAAVWWDGCDWDKEGNVARSYFINDTPYIMDIFKQYLNKVNSDWNDDIYA